MTTDHPNRRQILKTTAAASAVAAVSFPHIANAQGANNETIKVGLIGCGGRGTGAITQALKADPNTTFWAAADAFEAPLKRCANNVAALGERAKVAPERQFVGLDAYQKLIDSGVDVVLLCGPPGFRPKHIQAATAAGKHMFIEKPMAVDPASLRAVLKSAREAEAKGLSIQHGFCWRFAPGVIAGYEKVHSGDLGAVKSIYGTYLTSPVRPLANDAKKPEGMGDHEWHVANWINFDYLSGGPILEQAIHTVDKVAWAMKDALPIAAVANGGKIGRTDPGNVYDHNSVVYEYEGGVFAHVGQRQIPGCHNEVIDRVVCENGTMIGPGRCYTKDTSGKTTWRFSGEETNMYQNEHDELFAALRSGKQIKSADYMCNSTGLALLGTLAAYTGQRVTWDEMMNSPLDLGPDDFAFEDDFTPGPLPIPGQFKIS
ncbi:MAG: Gfo/Idh/MocA family oxidoreductase [Verrucomicrobiota bacterium JB023]|nr:Gfo/Idh/MocA family oxidoreductase [Verrucomicrobiota bacterium JB023]